jgi:hypothetical protein
MGKQRVMTIRYKNKAGETVSKTYTYNSYKTTSQCLVGKSTIHQERIREFKSKLNNEQRVVFNELLKEAIINKTYLSTNIVEKEFTKRGI